MGFLRFLVRTSPENPSTPLSNPDSWLWDAWGANKDIAGVAVTERTALHSVAVYACVRILSETVGTLPLPVYERVDGQGKRRAPGHPLYRILHDRPNPEMSKVTFFETLQAHLTLWGNAYAEIERDRAGRVLALWPLLPDRTRVRFVDGVRYYETTVPTGTGSPSVLLPATDVLHVPGLGYDGRRGYSVIAMARRAVGLTMATEEYGSRFFGNGSRPGGLLKHPGRLSPEAQTRLKESWEKTQGGLLNAHRVAILEEGMEWQKIAIDNDDAQFLETRKFQLTEMARLFRIPPHMLADLQAGASFASVEQMSLDFVVYTLRPWLVRWESSLNWDLFRPEEAGKFFAEFLVDGLLRGDAISRAGALQIQRQNGALSANEWREIENRNPIPDGDDYLVPLNMRPVGSPPPAETLPPSREPPAGGPAAREAALGWVLRDAVDRMLRREAASAERAVKRGLAPFLAWIDDFYPGHEEALQRAFLPVILALRGVGPATPASDPDYREAVAYVALLARDEVARGAGVLRAAADQAPPGKLELHVTDILAVWQRTHPDIVVHRELTARAV